jgi:hypothetical protein
MPSPLDGVVEQVQAKIKEEQLKMVQPHGTSPALLIPTPPTEPKYHRDLL